jgi:inosine/xanthosine triphosphate pyrophosphatase family protein
MTERRLVLASNNAGKLAELLPLFAPLGYSWSGVLTGHWRGG